MGKLGRRDALVGGVHLTVLAGASACASSGSSATVVPSGGEARVELATAPELGEIGRAYNFKVDGVKDYLVAVRVSEDEVRVLSRVCGHMGCKVNLAADAGSFDCPCHGSRFELDGGLIEGPSPTPLKRYEARVDGGVLVVSI